MFAVIQKSEDRLKEERREVGCQWESPEEERREVGCQWESPEEERREVGCQWESPEEERREVGCQWESPEEERREVGCQWESPEEERREVGCQWESPEEERREVGCQWESPEEERREVGCQWESLEEERREVGCQWESPEEERREVGCQSDSAERRDAAVQVDLLSQQLSWRHTGVCGVAWRCVSVRADEPGGGALLQHCRTHHSPPLGHTQLPTMPLFQSPTSPEFKELHQTTSLPSMPLDSSLLLLPPADVSAPPSGLIAPLSPHLAEELKVEVEGGVMDTEQVRRPRRKRVGPPIRYLLESEGQSHGLSVANHSRGVMVKEEEEEDVDEEEEEDVDEEEEVEEEEDVDEEEEVEEEEDVKEEDEEEEDVDEEEKEEEEEDVDEEEEVEEEEDVDEEEEKEEEEEEEVDGVKPVKTADTEQAGRPRRKTVGPPIRYLLESEEQSHGLSATNHSIARGAKVKMKPGRPRTEHQEEEERRAEVELCQVCGLTFTCESSLQLHLSVHRAGSQLSFTNTSPLHHHHHNKQEERMERRDEEEVKTLLPVSTKASDWLRCRKRVRSNPRWWVDFCTTMRRRRQERDGARGRKRRRCREEEEQEKGGGGGEEKVEEEQPQRPRRTRVGPPIRYLLESEELSHWPITTNQGRVGGWREGRKPQKKINAGGGASDDVAMIDSPELTEHSDQTNQDRGNRLKESGGRPNKVGIESEAGGGASERHKTLIPASTKASDWLRRRELVRRDPRWWVDYRATMRRRRQDRDGARGRKRRRCREEEEQEKGGGGGEEKVEEEQPQRPRRTRVGPPIRYLLESEELSHWPITTNQGRAGGWREGRKPQKKINSGGGASDDVAMIDSPEFTEQSVWTNQNRGNRLKESGGRPNKVGIECNAGGGASERHKTLLPASTKASDWLRCRKRVRRNPRWWVDYRATMRRRRQERDGARGRKRRRCREEEEQEKGGGGGEEKVEEEQPQRPRRTRVGPPIRYLLESEELSHWPITTNQGRAGGWREGRKPQKKINSGGGASDDVAMIDSPEFTEQSVWTNQNRGNRLKESGGRPNKVGIECNAGGGASERHKTLLPASTKASDWLRCRKRVRRNPRWWVDYRATMRRRRQERDGARGRKRRRCREEEEQEKGGGGGEEKVEEEQPQRPRRTRVGPPIRYLLESEELSHWPITTNQGRAGGWREGRKLQKKINAGGGASERHKTLLPASTKASDWLRHRNPRWWVDYRATMRRRRQDRDGARGRKRRRCREEEEDTSPPSLEVKDVCLKEEGEGEEEKGGEDEEAERQTEVKKEKEQPQKPRRTMVGPPIRYLLESEELSHGLATAYQDRPGDFKERRKPQKKSKVGGGASEETAMIDRPEDTDWQAERQMGLTNQDRVDGPNERGGSPNKVMIHREARGGASEMTDRATPVSDRQTGSYRRSYLVYIDLQSSQVTVLSPCCVRLRRLPLIG